jgi:uncharacterized membrane protein
MDTLLREFGGHIVLVLEAVSVLMIVIGGSEALWRLLRACVRWRVSHDVRREAWLGLARWLLLGLEFMLAADIIRSLIAPTWDEIGRLASIALIRTFLNYFLERDLEHAARHAASVELPNPEEP